MPPEGLKPHPEDETSPLAVCRRNPNPQRPPKPTPLDPRCTPGFMMGRSLPGGNGFLTLCQAGENCHRREPVVTRNRLRGALPRWLGRFPIGDLEIGAECVARQIAFFNGLFSEVTKPIYTKRVRKNPKCFLVIFNVSGLDRHCQCRLEGSTSQFRHRRINVRFFYVWSLNCS